MISAANEPLPRLLQGIGELPMAELSCHLDVHGGLGDLHRRSPEQIRDLVRKAGLLGHGGAAFPAAKKMDAVASRRRPKIVVANGTEGEPASKKDRVMLREAPHLVLDGAAVAARAVGADVAVIAVSERNPRTVESVTRALQERQRAGLPGDPRFELVTTPELWLAGQESALMNFLNGGPVKPTFGTRPFERGVDQRPTLVQNVETLAHLALIARHGAAWYRQLGTERAPGSTLVTLSGAVGAPGVYEIDPGMQFGELLAVAEAHEPLRGVLVGGYFGTWLPAEAASRVTLAAEHFAEHGASLGAGVIVALGSSACPVAETARVAEYFAAQNAGQCGPCVHGLDAIAYTIQQVATGTADRPAHADLTRWLAELPGRGACQHPDGSARFLASALRLFAEDFADHARLGPCDLCSAAPVLPTPGVVTYATA